jgi:hypothetical protein
MVSPTHHIAKAHAAPITTPMTAVNTWAPKAIGIPATAPHALPTAVKKQVTIKRFQSMINRDLVRKPTI